MKYHIYTNTSNYDGTDYGQELGHTRLDKIGELTPAANLECSFFCKERLWNPETGFRRGMFKIGKFWLVDDEEHTMMQLEDAKRQED